MNFTFRAYFSGLCVFVAKPGSLSVFLRNGRHPHTNLLSQSLPHHSPLIRFAVKQLDSNASTRQPDLMRADPASPDSWGICFLDYEEIKLVEGPGSGAQRPLKVVSGLRQNGADQPQSPIDSGDFSWVADIAKIVPPHGTIDPQCWQSLPPKDLVAARMEIKAGRVQASDWVTYGQEQVPVWQFIPGGAPGYQQVMAARVELILDQQTAPVTLQLNRFGQKETQKLVFAPADGVSPVEIGIWNVDLADVLDGLYGFGGQSLERHAPQQVAVRDFTSLYSFSATRPGVLPVPDQLQRYAAAALKPAGGNVACPGASMHG
jgi:hypothetical protein